MESGALLGILIFVLVFMAFYGDAVLVISMFTGDASFLTYEANLLFVIIAVIADIILLSILFTSKIKSPLTNSAKFAFGGLRRKIGVFSRRKKSCIENEQLYLEQVQALRDKGINKEKNRQQKNLLELFIRIENDEKVTACYEQILENEKTLTVIDDIERKLLEIANRYKLNGDYEKSKFYYEIANGKLSKEERERFETEYKDNQILQQKEYNALKKWVAATLAVITVAFLVGLGIYSSNAPYREMSRMIEDKSLTSDMLDYSNKNNDDSYYSYLKCKKGYKFIAEEFTKLHKTNDIDTALWLLCIQPDCIDGSDVCTSESFSNWILDYAKNNGTKGQTNGGRDRYEVDGYIITYYYDNIFNISDGENENTIEDRIEVAGAEPVQVIE